MRAYTLVFGLSANPVHQGHIALATQAVAGLRARGRSVERLLLVPVYRRNPVGARKDDLPATFGHRLAMCSLAAGDIARSLDPQSLPVETSRTEADLVRWSEEPNYTARTLACLKQTFRGSELAFLLSSELLSGPSPEFARWHEPDTIIALATLVVCPRSGYAPNAAFVADLEGKGARIWLLDEARLPDIAARQLRARLAASEDPWDLARDGMLSHSIAGYLQEHPIYKQVQNSAIEFGNGPSVS